MWVAAFPYPVIIEIVAAGITGAGIKIILFFIRHRPLSSFILLPKYSNFPIDKNYYII
jgi:hypothetical protein